MGSRLLILLLTAAVSVGCNRGLDRPIHFVLPNEYSGPLVIVANSAYPDRVEKQADRYLVTVPDDGVVRTKNLRIFQRWHQTSAAYQDGTSLPSSDRPSHRLFAAFTSSSDNRTYRSWYFVGSHDEFKAFFYGPGSSANSRDWLKSHGASRKGDQDSSPPAA